MSDPVKLDENVLFFQKGQVSTGKGLKVVIVDVCAVCTRSYLFFVPVKETSATILGRARQQAVGDKVAVEQMVAEIVNRPGQSVAQLEAAMSELLAGADDRVFQLDQLKSYKVSGFGPLTQMRLKVEGKIQPWVFVAKGKGAMKKLKAFYS